MLVCHDHDNAIRWKPGERLDQLFERRCDMLQEAGKPNHIAVFAQDTRHSFQELDNRANQVARYLISKGIASGDRIGLLFDKSFNSYVALLGVFCRTPRICAAQHHIE